MARLKDKYRNEVVPALMKHFEYKNIMQAPRLEKAVINIGVGQAMDVPLPRVRDLGGVSKSSLDGRGNFAMGLREQLIFPEIEYDKIDKVRGMDVIITTTAKTDEEARGLLKGM